MPIFQAKIIKSAPSLGETLLQRRQELGLEIRQAARDTKISARYLQALESGQYHQLPGDVYAKSFLKVYATYLSLDPQALCNEYNSEQKIFNKTSGSDNVLDVKKPVERILWSKLVVTPKIIRNALIGSVVLVILLYLGVKLNAIVQPPQLVVEEPNDNFVTELKIIKISGAAEQEAVVKINGQPVLTDESGRFDETFVLQEGANVIEVTAEKKRSKQAVIYRKVMVITEG